MLARQPAVPTLAERQAADEHVDRLTPAGRAQKFPRAISLKPSIGVDRVIVLTLPRS
jgi:hypothetical protein